MVTRSRVIAIGLACGLVLVPGRQPPVPLGAQEVQPPAREAPFAGPPPRPASPKSPSSLAPLPVDAALCAAVELALPEVGERLAAVPHDFRDGEWKLLSALWELSQGRSDAALAHALEGAQALGSARAWVLGCFIATQSAVLQVSAAREGAPEVPAPWRAHPDVQRIESLVRWMRAVEGRTLVLPVELRKITPHGRWPEPLVSVPGRRPQEPHDAQARTDWYREEPERLLRRLCGTAVVQRPFQRALPGRWVLVSYLGDVTQVRRLARGSARLHAHLREAVPAATLVSLWVGQGSQVQVPLDLANDFALFTAEAPPALLAGPGFESGGVHVLIDPEQIVRLVIFPGIPLPVLGSTLARILEHH